jgi:endonuclease/exonuclease/phosphatase family metal-dependent hydrolase
MKLFKLILLFMVLTIVSCAKKTVQNSTVPSLAVRFDGNLRVLCYNIHHANPPSKPNVIDMAAIANVIKREQPHLVALQEVDVHTQRSGKSVHQAEELARMTGMTAYFAKAINYEGGEYGIAILSNLPMEEMKNIPIPTASGTDGEPRTLATAVITLPEGNKIVFANTHMDAQRQDTNRFLQINKIVEVLQQEKYPVIIAGDFNAVPGTRIINILDNYFMRTCITGCGFTVSQINPIRTIDFIAFRKPNQFKVIEHRVIDEKYASDHLPVLAVVRVKQ